MRVDSWPNLAGPRLLIPVAALVAGTSVVSVPSLAGQGSIVALVLGAVALLLYARSGRTPNAAWIAVLVIFLINPLSAFADAVRLPLSVVVLNAALPLPFAVLALSQDRGALRRLGRLTPFVALVAWAALSIAWSSDPEYGLRKLTLWVLAGLLPAAAILALASAERPFSWRLLLTAATIYAIVLLLTGTTSIYPGRLTFFEGNPIWIGRASFIGVLVAVFWPGPLLVRGVVLVPLILAGLATDSRGPTIGLVLGLLAGLAESLRVAPRAVAPTWVRLSIVGVLVTIGVAIATGILLYRPDLLSPLAADTDISSRAQYLDVSLQMFAAAPILGQGFGAFASRGLLDVYPHNLAAELGSELGVIGLLLLAVWLVVVVRAARGTPVLMGLVVATGAFALFSGNVAGNTEFWVFCALALALAAERAPSAAHVVAASSGAMIPAPERPT